MASASGGGSGQRTTQNSTTSVDKETADWMRSIWGAGQAAGNAGPSPLLTGAAGYGSAAQRGGQLGMDALGGSQGAVSQLMNPYIHDVMEQNNNAWGQINQQTSNQVDDAATKARAFGGSRHGVAEGVALGQNNMAQAQQNAGLLSQGYTDAMQQAGALAGYGFQGAGMNQGLGMAGVGSPELWRMLAMKQGFMGPMGSTSSGRQNTVAANGGFKIGV